MKADTNSYQSRTVEGQAFNRAAFVSQILQNKIKITKIEVCIKLALEDVSGSLCVYSFIEAYQSKKKFLQSKFFLTLHYKLTLKIWRGISVRL